MCNQSVAETVAGLLFIRKYEAAFAQSFQALDAAVELLRERMPARVMTAQELATYCGAAWAEVWFYDDGETEESKELYPVAVCCGHLVTADGSITPAGRTFEILNRPYGLRLWTDKPTPEQQDEAWQ